MTIKITFLSLLIVLGSVAFAHAQETDLTPSVRQAPKEDPPRGLEDALVKMRIEKNKKDFNDMLKRGDDVVKLAERLGDPASSAADQHEIVSNIGKLVKKIRDELGGDDDGGNDQDAKPPTSSADAVEALKQRVNSLSEELKKVNRFTVSAEAIERANDVLRLVKYLRG